MRKITLDSFEDGNGRVYVAQVDGRTHVLGALPQNESAVRIIVEKARKLFGNNIQIDWGDEFLEITVQRGTSICGHCGQPVLDSRNWERSERIAAELNTRGNPFTGMPWRQYVEPTYFCSTNCILHGAEAMRKRIQ